MHDTLHIRCAYVNDDGSTTLTYETSNVETSNAASTFINYTIAYSISGQSDSTIVGTNPIITSGTFTDISQNANNGSVNYIITPVFADSVMVSGNIKTMYLEATAISPSSILLQWSPTGIIQGNENSQYKIYRSRLVGGETDMLIASIPFSTSNEPLSHTDNFSVPCLDTFVYYVELDNDYPCISRSNKVSVRVSDEEDPDKPDINFVTTDLSTQKINISWSPSSAADTYGYVLLTGNVPRFPFDTVYGANNTSYVCDTCSSQTIYYLSVLSIDTCFNSSPVSDRHNNMVLHSERVQCSNEVILKWNAYNNMMNGLSGYEVYSSTDNISFNYIKTLSPSDTVTSVNINISYPTYYFYVKAKGNINGYESTSNINILNIASADMADYIYIRSVSVEQDNNHISLSFFVDSTLVVPHYKLQRSDDGLSFNDVATITYSGKGSFSYIDNLPRSAADVIYTYKLLAPDVCLTAYKESDAVSSIRLKASEQGGEANDLQWNGYNGWNAVNNYDIYRSAASSSQPPYFIGTSTSTLFTDNNANVVSDSYNITYNVLAKELGVGADGIQQTASSSYASIRKQTLCWIPNAFTPTGNQNNIFNPAISFVKEGSYRMRIYNRYGQVLFSTTDLSQGWDGTYEGHLVKSDTYIYYIEFVNSEGEKEYRKGTFAVID
jgi:gliding motility-associated-like protein